MSTSSISLTNWELHTQLHTGAPPRVVPLAIPCAVGEALPEETELDEHAYVYRCRFARPPSGVTELHLPEIGTLATVSLNGETLATLRNAHRRTTLELGAHLADDNLLEIAIAPLLPELARKRPRPRWKTRITPHQNLRWIRTPLYGRMPGWTPNRPPVGLLGPVTLEVPRPRITRLVAEYEGAVGLVSIACEGASDEGGVLQVGAEHVELRDGAAQLLIRDPIAWWPHTHGAPHLYPATLYVGGVAHALPPVGFRTVVIDRDADGQGFGLVINGVPIFARGASWMPTAPDRVARALDELVLAGMNMVRLSGTIGYESDAFYAACAARGLLLWQDFAFANFDYPNDDALTAEIDAEANELLARLGANPSLVVLCGGSEVAQQASMMGVAESQAQSALFAEGGVLQRAAAAHRPDVVYVPSTPWGGPRPFVVDEGIGHYYGVGAYLRPLADARQARVRFAAECLAFANVPEPASIERLLGPGEIAPQHARWKAGVPADRGVGWDFDDVRDHYVGTLFATDSATLRYADPERYLDLGRVAIGEVMARTFAEWRRPGSSCRGALVWYGSDLQRGPGLGLIDSDGQRKSVWYYVQRVLQPRTVLLLDEGSNGVKAHLVNDLDHPWEGTLSMCVGRRPALILEQHAQPFVCPARGALTIDVEQAIGRFFDAAYSYRFGPPTHDVITASVAGLGVPPDGRGGPTAALWRLPLLRDTAAESALSAGATREGASIVVTITAKAWRSAVAVRADGYAASDNYLTLRPGETVAIRLVPRFADARFAAEIFALEEPHPLGVSLS